jgi:membrane fusion protein, copper/silver efflux system
MKKPINALLLLALLIGSFLGGTWYKQGGAGKGHDTQGGRRLLCYVDPMNPAHTSDRPGMAPCGMPMEPVYADEESTGQGSSSLAAGMPPGTVKITPQKQQLIGVRVDTVRLAEQTYPLRTLGRVAPDENRVHRVLAAVDGWTLDVYGSTSSSLVQKDQLMGTFYTTELFNKQVQYLYAAGLADRRQPSGAQPSEGNRAEEQVAHMNAPYSLTTLSPGSGDLKDPVQLSRVELLLMGMGETQLQKLTRTKQYVSNIEIRSPITGVILARNFAPRLRFERGTEFFRIADLSRVWVLADIFEGESQHIRPGAIARVWVPGQSQTVEATVSDILPPFDPTTRALKVRLELDNPGFTLRPDMFVDVEFLVHFPQALTLPTDAVLDSGRLKIVFVSVGKGYFEPREVVTGRRFGGQVEVLQGIMPGEEIVVSGNFLVDSESKMKLAAAGMQSFEAKEKDLVCGMPVRPGQADDPALSYEHEGVVYHFCSEQCRRDFQEAPERFLRKPLAPSHSYGAPVVSGRDFRSSPAKDPVCACEVDASKAGGSGLTAEFLGKTFYFCSEDCKNRFQKHPERYVDERGTVRLPAEPKDHSGHAEPPGHAGHPPMAPTGAATPRTGEAR